ncbi:hypothetical protein P7C70_g5484, partial [Phenoliferia sp. Uapishka_3]
MDDDGRSNLAIFFAGLDTEQKLHYLVENLTGYDAIPLFPFATPADSLVWAKDTLADDLEQVNGSQHAILDVLLGALADTFGDEELCAENFIGGPDGLLGYFQTVEEGWMRLLELIQAESDRDEDSVANAVSQVRLQLLVAFLEEAEDTMCETLELFLEVFEPWKDAAVERVQAERDERESQQARKKKAKPVVRFLSICFRQANFPVIPDTNKGPINMLQWRLKFNTIEEKQEHDQEEWDRNREVNESRSEEAAERAKKNLMERKRITKRQNAIRTNNIREKRMEKDKKEGRRDKITGKLFRKKLDCHFLQQAEALASKDPEELRRRVAENSRPATAIKKAAKTFRPGRAGRKSDPAGKATTKAGKGAERTNWQAPYLWDSIAAAAARPSIGFSGTAIMHHLKRDRSPENPYRAILPGTIQKWFNKRKDGWDPKVLERVAQWHKPGRTTRVTMFKTLPELANRVEDTLRAIRDAGTAVTARTASAVIMALVKKMAPHLLEAEVPFTCSQAFVKKYLNVELDWSFRQATAQSRKLPDDWEQQGWEAGMRIAYLMRKWKIPAALTTNFDQTMVTLRPSAKETYEERGSTQVLMNEIDEKRAFTLGVASSMRGDFLPAQLIWEGKTVRSLPSLKAQAPGLERGFINSCGGHNHWTKLPQMKEYVEGILVPYYRKICLELDLEMYKQKMIFYIDVYTVHISKAYRAWMIDNYPYIIVIYVPANCTSKFQPQDVGQQFIIKQIITRSYLAHITSLICEEFDRGTPPEEIALPTTLGALRDASVAWIVKAYDHGVENPDWVKKAWAGCKAKGINFSHECLTSHDVLDALDDLWETNPKFLAELKKGVNGQDGPLADDATDEEHAAFAEANEEDARQKMTGLEDVPDDWDEGYPAI